MAFVLGDVVPNVIFVAVVINVAVNIVGYVIAVVIVGEICWRWQFWS